MVCHYSYLLKEIMTQIKTLKILLKTILALSLICLGTACTTPSRPPVNSPPVENDTTEVLPKPVIEEKAPTEDATHPVSVQRDKGFSIQVAAFSRKSSAQKSADNLGSKGMDATVCQTVHGMWAVRCGHFTAIESAKACGKKLLDQGVINDFFVVNSTPSHGPLPLAIVQTARTYLGVKYTWGGSSAKQGFDCSGFTWAVYKKHGYKLARVARDQYKMGIPVSKSKLREGDLLFFSTERNQSISHVGIYTGSGKFIHASTGAKKIKIANLSTSYYKKHYLGARRVILQ